MAQANTVASRFRSRTFVQGLNGKVTSFAWSPDGARIGCCSDEGSVAIFDSHSGEELVAFTLPGRNITAFAWSPDGKQIAFASSDITIATLSNRTLQTLPGHSKSIWSLSWCQKASCWPPVHSIGSFLCGTRGPTNRSHNSPAIATRLHLSAGHLKANASYRRQRTGQSVYGARLASRSYDVDLCSEPIKVPFGALPGHRMAMRWHLAVKTKPS